MTVSCKIDAARRIIVATFHDPWSASEIAEIIDQARNDPRFEMDMGTLLDFRNVTSVPSAAEIEGYAAYFARQLERRGVKRALVVSADLQYGMARMAAAHAESQGMLVRVFRDIEAALDWLAD